MTRDIEELTLKKEEISKGFKKVALSSFVIYGGLALMSWGIFGGLTGKWNPKEYINYLKERQENSKFLEDSPSEKYLLF